MSTLSEWIDDYCEQNEIELPSGIPDEKTAICFLCLNKSEGGGGGGGDFTTAEVTLNITVSGKTLVETFVDTASIMFPTENIFYMSSVILSDNGKLSILLYQNYAEIGGFGAIDTEDNEYYTIVGEPILTGNIQYNNDTGYFEVTGDCSITVELR